ncbi:hypothetical protein SELMODRAFT_427222 [Selaginella moellendorffii]|uniref:ATPase domain-containing protein n=2 Tax=Selaginella moellendorffii TaxID=88036 RepID=D8SYX6_SELML|nr:hypothetical protein SELMODRAFT_427222 [Selaginella moellendorffii]
MAFFGREKELDALSQLVGAERVVLVLGPKNSGKTALLQKFRATSELPIFLLDMRMDIEDQVLQWQAGVENFLVQGLDAVLRELGLARRKKGKKAPVFILDCAHKIKALPGAAELFRNLLRIAQDKIATIIMASWDDSLREDWIGDRFTELIYVDHFSEAQAREFFSGLLVSQVSSSSGSPGHGWWRRWWRWSCGNPLPPPAAPPRVLSLNDEEWGKIYRVCGGCPLLLKRCANQVFSVNIMPLDNSLGTMAASVASLVSFGLEGDDQGWDVEMFKRVMELLVDRDGAVEWATVCSKVFGGDEGACKAQLKAMAANGVIHIKCVPSESIKMVEPISPPHLQAMRDELEHSGYDSDDDD